MDDLDKTITEIMQRIEKTGDLPVFSASVNRIRQISSSAEATAMSLSKEATKDVNLTAKLLRLANSSYYNRGKGKICVISRAVVILGFDTVKNQCLTMKLIDSFQHEHPSIEMNKMLVNAYLTAGFVREIASKAGIKDIEEAYTCALLHNLGEIAIAYFLPEKFSLMEDMRINQKISRKEVEKNVLGGPVKEVGQILAKSWEFPSNIVTTMEPFNPDRESTKSSPQMNKALSSLASSVVQILRSPDSESDSSLNDMLSTLAKTAGLQPGAIEISLTDSFKMSCELATEYGLKQETLMPAMEDTDDEKRDRIASNLAFFASNEIPASDKSSASPIPATKQSKEAVSLTISKPDTNNRPDDDSDLNQSAIQLAVNALSSTTDDLTLTKPVINSSDKTSKPQIEKTNCSNFDVQLLILQETTFLISNQASLQQVFKKSLEGIISGVGFDRAMLTLISPDRSNYSARLVLGEQSSILQDYFNFPINEEHDIFSKVLMEGSELLIEDISEAGWKRVIRKDFEEMCGTNSFIIASLCPGSKAIGFIYADNGISHNAISTEQHRGFIQFVAQARLAIQVGATNKR